jgi:hypothetical protein
MTTKFLTYNITENSMRRAQAKEREAGRLARIRDNNARVDAMTDAYHSKIYTDDSRRIATVKRQQEGYAQVCDLLPPYSFFFFSLSSKV